MNESTALDDAIADLFDLDTQTEYAADFDGSGRSVDCTNSDDGDAVHMSKEVHDDLA